MIPQIFHIADAPQRCDDSIHNPAYPRGPLDIYIQFDIVPAANDPGCQATLRTDLCSCIRSCEFATDFRCDLLTYSQSTQSCCLQTAKPAPQIRWRLPGMLPNTAIIGDYTSFDLIGSKFPTGDFKIIQPSADACFDQCQTVVPPFVDPAGVARVGCLSVAFDVNTQYCYPKTYDHANPQGPAGDTITVYASGNPLPSKAVSPDISTTPTNVAPPATTTAPVTDATNNNNNNGDGQITADPLAIVSPTAVANNSDASASTHLNSASGPSGGGGSDDRNGASNSGPHIIRPSPSSNTTSLISAAPSPSSSNQLSPGIIAAFVACGILILLLAIALAVFLWAYRRRLAAGAAKNTDDPNTFLSLNYTDSRDGGFGGPIDSYNTAVAPASLPLPSKAPVSEKARSLAVPMDGFAQQQQPPPAARDRKSEKLERLEGERARDILDRFEMSSSPMAHCDGEERVLPAYDEARRNDVGSFLMQQLLLKKEMRG